MATEGWGGRYTVEDDPASGWHDCRVLDISMLGVGLELLPARCEEIEALMGRRLVVHVQSPMGDSISLRLVGQVRNVRDGRSGGVRAGLAFVGLSETERAIVRVIEQLKVVW